MKPSATFREHLARVDGRRTLVALALAIFLEAAGAAEALTIQFRAGATSLLLDSADARQQLLAVAGDGRDVTREAAWAVEPPGLATVDKLGRITP
ncbi:MAG: hypothetical protein ACKVYV_14700, partial [Limisphaerales bacterium]